MSENPEFKTHQRYLRLAEAALDAADLFDDTRDCTCADDGGNCWYHLSEDEQNRARLDFIADAIDYEDHD